MPTGYTAAIKDGITFRQFAMNCARAFGATITMRDDGGDGSNIPERFEPSDYHLKELRKAQNELAVLSAMTPEDVAKRASEDYEAAEARRLETLREKRELRAKYEAMLAEVKAWKTPTPDHIQFRNFMLEQIGSSIDFDCGESYYDKPTQRLTPEEWLLGRRSKIEGDIDYHTKNYAEEVERTEKRNAWIKALRDSLPTEEAA